MNFPRRAFDCGPDVGLPLLDRGFVPLNRATLRFLERPTNGAKNAAHVRRVVLYSELPLDHVRHASQGPDVASEAERLGPAQEQIRDLRSLLFGEEKWRSGRRPMLKRLLAALSCLPHPLADGAFGDAEGLSDDVLLPASALQFESLKSPRLFPVDCRFDHHGSIP